MKKFLVLLIVGLVISACSIKEPRISFGKKCVEKDNQVVYSYVWVWDKSVGLTANEANCELIDNIDKK
jgi:hypothetical protein